MNISYNWLKDYVDFSLTPAETCDALTSTGLETDGLEEVESIRGGLRGLVIGKVLTCVEHPDSDHLHITTVDLGTGEPTQIVCGAPNVAAGQTVVVATVGTTLYDGDKEFQIKRSKIRGVESLGMICAEDEIGVGTSHDGIIVIDKEVAPGTPAAEYYGLESDYVLEVDLTPNRIDAASHFGVARDLNAYLSRHLTPGNLRRPSVEGFAPDRADGAIPVEVLDPQGAPHYSGLTIRGVKVAESPEWLRRRLTDIGLRPINNIVDITNYILHGFGQPLHCFDLDKVEGGKIVVRTCPEGTRFTTLDGVERTLSEADLMICDAVGPMCIAGVFGGLDSGVTEATTSVFIESACFNPTRVRKTARRHGLSTDASFRYERGCDPNATIYNLKLAALMIKELAGGEICGEPFDFYPEPVAPYPVELSSAYLDSLVGKHIPADEAETIMASLEIEVASKEACPDGSVTWQLRVPTYRVDVRRPCDVVEEILRIYGYNNVEYSTTVHSSLQFKTPTDEAADLQALISEQLTAQGFNEIMNNSLTSAALYDGLEAYPADRCVALLNPLSSDLGVMRQSLIFGGLESLAHNLNRKADDLAMYEFGHVYFFRSESESTADAPLAPYKEGARLAMWLCGDRRKGNWARKAEEATFFDLKAALEAVLGRLGLDPRQVVTEPSADNDLFAAALAVKSRNGKVLGHIGLVAKKLLRKFDISLPVAFAELDWEALCRLAGKQKVEFTPLPKTLPVRRDLALLVDRQVTFADIESAVRQAGGKLLSDVELFDVYEGENLPAGKKSYAVTFTLQDPEKTLADKQIEAAVARIVANLAKRTGAELR
ncbi:phenylalanine--tRNA ligase subunit beta [Muribaculaceae bacterium Isolate-013 (NCI)]|nr:phenylalanine--tRNA ligase subunit beta [Muribaculaceae bacterium Isolate-013 (NCI)]